MSDGGVDPFVLEVIEAHGGLERWRSVRAIRGRVRTGGLLPRTRFPGTRLRDARLEVEPGAIRAVGGSFPEPGRRGVFERGTVWIETEGGEVLASRERPREAFFGASGLRRNLRWDELDTAYFAGYAWWNYLSFPLLLLHDGVEVSLAGPRRLDVSFPPGLDTHSPRQSFHLDEGLRLRRHDYTAEVVGSWARAVHLCEDHVEVDGLVFPTRRRVYPAGPRGGPLRAPTLVALDLSEIEVDYS